MNRLLTLFSLCLMGFGLSAQIVITEIMYNPPESGNDSLEYIELHNAGSSSVDIGGYEFDQGVSHTFARRVMSPGSYLVIAVDSVALKSTLGIDALQWTSGALSNGGEDIILLNSSGNEVDLVDYKNGGDWPSDANANGSSLELCDVNRDNSDPANWKASESGRGIVIEGNEVKGTPGFLNGVSCADYVVEVRNNFFDQDTLTVYLGETVEWQAVEGFHNVNGSLATYPSNPEGFSNGSPANAPWTFSHTFTLEGTYDYQCDPHVLLGMTGHIIVLDPQIPDLIITEIMYNDPGADSIEFIEIYNNEAVNVSLNGLRFSSGVDYDFPDVLLPAGGHFVIAQNVDAYETVFGPGALQWTSGTLPNFGGNIEIVNAAGLVVDFVLYDDRAPWPTGANGEGQSLVLCNLNGDNNDASNWKTAGTGTGVIRDGLEIFANPGIQDPCDNVNTYPKYDIGSLEGVNTNGIPDSNGISCEIEGIVHGIDLQGGGAIQFTIIDNTGGIGVFSPVDFGYSVQEGDRVSLKGEIEQFRGLTQMSPDSLRMISSGNATENALDVTVLDESTESEIVRLVAVQLVDDSQWLGDGSSFSVDVTDGVITYDVRIDNDVELSTMTPPQGLFNLTGIGSQFDLNEPLTEDYRLAPRYAADIDLISGIYNRFDVEFGLYPNPTKSSLVISYEGTVSSIEIYNTTSQLVMTGKGKLINVESLEGGTYFLKLTSQDGVGIKKFIKK